MTEMTWGPGPATIAPLDEPRRGSTTRIIFGALVAIVILGAVAIAFASVVNDSASAKFEIHQDAVQGISWGSPLNTDWSCGMVTSTDFACAGESSGPVAVTSGSREAADIREDLLAGAVASVRYDDRQWRCDGSVSSYSGIVRATSCTQRR